jgi:aminopeptidase
MTDTSFSKLAHNLVKYSTAIKKGEKVLIEVFAPEIPLTKALIKEVYDSGGQPFLSFPYGRMQAEWLKDASEDAIKTLATWDAARMNEMDAYIGIRIRDNIYEMSTVPEKQLQTFNLLYNQPVHMEIRVPKTKWVVLRYPNDSMAQEAGMSTEAFRDFYFSVCNFDYAKMSAAMDPLQKLLAATDKVEIKAPKIDLRFSVKGISNVKCDGKVNIPDGEVYTAPVRDSVEGEITYNTPSLYEGQVFENIHFIFERGKIIHAEAGVKTDALNAILNTDEGARYIGEFAFGLHPHIKEPINDILFDEKICGSFHFTPGSCYDEAENGNHSAIHWDLVNIMREEYGGGEIYFDGKLISKDGIFVLPELEALNPETLL